MKAISDVIAELVHAANIAGRLSDDEKLFLLNHAYVTIQAGAEALDGQETTMDSDVALDILSSTKMVSQLSEEEFRSLLLEAADMIRSIKIMLDSKRAAGQPGDP